MSRSIRAFIDLAALEHNLTVVRRYAAHTRIMAVIKADAYGHGLLHTAKALRKADGFAMLELDAAIRLRDAGYQQSILLLEGFFSVSELAQCKKYRLSAVIHNHEQLAMLSASKHGRLDVFLKMNTGMNRLGFAPEQFLSALEALKASPAIGHITLMTHFSSASDTDGDQEVIKQLQCFNSMTTGHSYPRSLANSAAIIRYPETHADWVRPGIMLYGASPLTNKTAAELDLHPAMTVTSKIIATQYLQSGNKVGYSGCFQADRPMLIGIVAGGYADGYPRHAPTGTPVLVNNQRTRILGRVSMDMLTVDLSGIKDVGLNSPVVLWGKGMPVDEVANAANTISYELLCALTPRVTKTAQDHTLTHCARGGL